MKLFYSTTSPYSRKARVIAIEKGLADRLALEHCNPHELFPPLLEANPLHRVPTLVTDSGEVLFDSPVICEWLDSLVPEPCLLPAGGSPRWMVLRGQALADGMLDDAVAIVLERRRPENLQSAETIDARQAVLLRCAGVLEADVPALPRTLNLAHISVGCALGYLDFRMPELDWRSGHPALTEWFEQFAHRPAMMATRPELPPP
jgi:glutathione S-transferase